MRQLFSVLAIALLTTPAWLAGAYSADLILDPPAAAPAPADLSLYVKLYGGAALEGTLEWYDDDYDTDTGYFYGAALGSNVGVDGLSAELDLATSSAKYSGYDNSLDATTLMANIIYTVGISDMFKLYGGAGIGAAYVKYVNSYGDADGWAPAAQVFVGVDASLTDNLSVFGEVRHQSAFSDVEVSGDYWGTFDVEYNRTAVLGGLKLGF